MEEEALPEIPSLPLRVFANESIALAVLTMCTLAAPQAFGPGTLAVVAAAGAIAATVFCIYAIAGPSGVYLNPFSAWADSARGTISTDDFARIVLAQFAGAAIGGLAIGVSGVHSTPLASSLGGNLAEALMTVLAVVAASVASDVRSRWRGIAPAFASLLALPALGAWQMGNPAIALGAGFRQLMDGSISSLGPLLAAKTVAALVAVPLTLIWEGKGSATDPRG